MLLKIISNFKLKHPGFFPEWGKGLYLWSRSINARSRALPGFLIIGAQKSGSTSLFSYLSLHPNVLPSVQKEIFYFNRFYKRGAVWYRRFFPKKKQLLRGKFITGEASSTYLCSGESAQRAYKLLPDAKIVVILREPAARAVSHYHHRVYMGREFRPLVEVFSPAIIQAWSMGEIISEPSRVYLERGLYADQLKWWYACYPSRQLLVLKAEDMFHDLNRTLVQVHEFLGVKPMPLGEQRVFKRGVKCVCPAEDSIMAPLSDAYQRFNEQLYQMPTIDFSWE